MHPGALDVLAQHILGMACAAPFDADALYREVASAYPYRDLDRATFDQAVEFVATGGYALKTYERFAKIRQGIDGLWRITHPAHRPAIPPERRHHHRGAAAECSASPAIAARVSPAGQGASSARSRKASSRR